MASNVRRGIAAFFVLALAAPLLCGAETPKETDGVRNIFGSEVWCGTCFYLAGTMGQELVYRGSQFLTYAEVATRFCTTIDFWDEDMCIRAVLNLGAQVGYSMKYLGQALDLGCLINPLCHSHGPMENSQGYINSGSQFQSCVACQDNVEDYFGDDASFTGASAVQSASEGFCKYMVPKDLFYQSGSQTCIQAILEGARKEQGTKNDATLSLEKAKLCHYLHDCPMTAVQDFIKFSSRSIA